MDDSDDFWKHAKGLGISVEEIDMIFLLEECKDLVREFERFLRNNDKAKIYLPRENNEGHLRSLYNKLLPYSDIEQIQQWGKRTVFMDETEEQQWQVCHA
jgi:RNA-binding protein YhbY